MAALVGQGFVQIVPSMRGFKKAVADEVGGAGEDGKRSFASRFNLAGVGREAGNQLKQALNAGAQGAGADALASLKGEVASASKALSAVRLKQQDEAGKVRVAEARLAEAVQKSGAESAAAVAAEERLAAARRKHETATDAVKQATDRLKTAQAGLKDATDAASSGGSRFQDALGGAFNGAANLASSAAGRIRSAFSSAFEGASMAAGIAVAAMGAKIASLAPEAIRASDATEKFKSTLNFAGLDAGKIDELAAAAQDYADKTVYSLADIQSVTAQLGANGVKDFDKLAVAAGNLNAVAGGNADTFRSVGMVLTQTAGAGKLTTENWNQLANAIPGASGKLQEALLAAGAYTGNFRDAMAAGEISAEEFNQALLDLGMTQAAEEAATSTKTFEGAWGNFEAAIVGGLTKIMEPLKPFLTGAISKAADGVAAGFDKVAAAVEGVVGIFSKGDFDGSVWAKLGIEEGSALVGFLFDVRDGLQGVKAGLPDLTSLLGPAGGAMAAMGAGGLATLVSRIPMLSALLPGLSSGLGMLGGPLGIAAAAFAGFALTGGDATSLVAGFTGLIDGAVAMLPTLIDAVVQAVPAIVNGLLAAVPALLQAGTGILTALISGITTALPMLVQGALDLVNGLLGGIVAALPMIIEAAVTLVTTLLQGLIGALPLLVDGAIQLLTGLVTAILENLPLIIDAAIQLVTSLAMGLVAALPQLLTAALDLVLSLATALIENLPMLIQSGIELVVGLVTGLIGALPQLLVAAIDLVLGLVSGLLSNLPQLVTAGIDLIFALIEGLVGAIPDIVAAIPKIVTAIWDAITQVDWISLGVKIIEGLIDGIGSMAESVMSAVGGIVGGIADFFPHSPAKRGPMSGKGYPGHSGKAIMGDLAASLRSGVPDVEDAATAAAQAASFTAQASVAAASSTSFTQTATTAGPVGQVGAPMTVNVYGDARSTRAIAAEVVDEASYRWRSAL